jgi:glycosyltransferase 2 family protein
LRDRRLVAVLLCIVVVGGLWLVTRRALEQGFRWERFRDTLASLDPFWLAAATLLALLTYAGRVIRWEVMLRPLAPNLRWGSLVSATAIGFTAVVLFGRAGELVRPYLIAVKERVPFSSQLAAWLLERIFDLLVVVVLFGVALAQVDATDSRIGPSVRWLIQQGGGLVALMGVVCLAALFALARYAHQLRNRLLEALSFLPDAYQERVDRTVTAFADGMSVTREARVMPLLALYTAVEWAIIVACYLCLFRSFPALAGLGLQDTLLFLGFVAFGSIIQIPGVGGGLQLATVIMLTEYFHQPLEVATSFALLLWAMTFLIIVPFGGLFAFREGLSWRSLRHIDVPAGGIQ